MKIVIKKEFDGTWYHAFCENIPGIYVQTLQEQELNTKMKRALTLIRNNCDSHRQPFPSGFDKPLFDIRIRFDKLTTDQLVKFFENQKYHVDYIDQESVILVNASYPFNRIHLPRVSQLSPLLVQKIFGEQNTIYTGGEMNMLNTRVSSSA